MYRAYRFVRLRDIGDTRPAASVIQAAEHQALVAVMAERAGVAVSDLSAFVPHQANLRIVEAIARRLGVPRERVADDIVHAGNTSSASIPLALARMTERGDLKSGSQALLLGFGAGMCYAAQVITVP